MAGCRRSRADRLALPTASRGHVWLTGGSHDSAGHQLPVQGAPLLGEPVARELARQSSARLRPRWTTSALDVSSGLSGRGSARSPASLQGVSALRHLQPRDGPAHHRSRDGELSRSRWGTINGVTGAAHSRDGQQPARGIEQHPS